MSSLVKVEQKGPAAAVALPEESQYLTFLLGGDMFAIGILNIKEIIEYGHLTSVPMMPEFIRGVINLRGRVVPVVDLRSRFGKPSSEVTKRTCIVIIEVQVEGSADEDPVTQDIGVIVDSVSEVLEIAAQDIEPPPAFGAHIRTDFIRGMGKVNGEFVIILSVENVLSVEEMAMLEKAAEVVAA
ncbi:chemotaxis protein CheW [Leeia oryzae]|uniref:chemotaxis protein CheW n=1 Tax=Leeia oryzae TaxID=356662 RepID=UPI000374A231|nr:chemotaxis protein CheW [Leeia oryzae]